MRRFRLLFLAVALALLAPLGFLVQRALHSVALERQLHHQAVAERVFDEMERSLSTLLEGEAAQAVNYYGRDDANASWPFVLGRFQVDGAGNVRVLPAGATTQAGANDIERRVGAYWRAARVPPAAGGNAAVQVPGTTIDLDNARPAGSRKLERDDLAAQKESEDVSALDVLRSLNKAGVERAERQRLADSLAVQEDFAVDEREAGVPHARGLDAAPGEPEAAPMVGRAIDAGHLMLYRTVARGGRQGALIDMAGLGEWLREQGLGSDGVREYARVSFATPFGSEPNDAAAQAYTYQHRFAEPFDDLSARLALRALPGVGSATYVYALAALVLTTTVLGLAALYRMVSVIVAFAERRSNFVAAVSHELKTPLTAIRMYGEMLRDGLVPSEAKRDEYHRQITTESERLSRLINNVLEFARLEKGTREVALASGALAPAVREVAQLMRPHVEREGFELCVAVGDALPPVRFEADAVMQILWNLVDNAIKYGRDGAPRRIELRAWHDGGGVHVAVRDHGPGVAARQLGKIFEPFYRGESELTRRNKGTGLGLALVRGLAERMDATVRARNVPDGGFEVEITFA